MSSLAHRDGRAIDLDNILRLRELALLSPLRRGDSLDWTGPTQVSASLPREDPVGQTHDRTVHTSLLSEEGPAKSSEPWVLKLVEPLQTGTNVDCQWGQVWRARASRGRGGENGGLSVVVKLYQEALFPDPQGSDNVEEGGYARLTADQTEFFESRVYSRAQVLQGSVIPLCYGFYYFVMSDGTQVTGVVLEDLTEISDPIEDFVEQLERRGKLSLENVDTLTRAALRNLSRLHDLDLSHAPSASDIFVLRSSDPTHPSLIFIDFSESQTREEIEKAQKLWPQQFNGVPARLLPRMWLSPDHFSLMATFDYVIGDKFREWMQRERKENKHNLMGEPHRLIE